MSNEKTPVAYLHQVVCGDGEPDQALSFEPDNFPLSGVLGYRSLSHEPLFRAEPSNELERLRAALWQCFTDAGGDTDGKTDAAGISTDDLISTTTDCVKDLRLGYDEMLDESSEADRLRARVAKLESARGEPVAWMNPYGGTLQVRITGLEYEKYTIPLYTAPPAQAVDVDAISENEQLRRDLEIALDMLAQWCVAVDVNGTGWDDWDEYYKDAAYRPGPLREQLDAAIAEVRKQRQ